MHGPQTQGTNADLFRPCEMHDRPGVRMIGTGPDDIDRHHSADIRLPLQPTMTSSADIRSETVTELTHFDETGASRMVDVGGKPVTHRRARAEGFVRTQPETLRRIQQHEIGKGDVIEVARLAGIMATKRTDELIPLCHSLGLDHASIQFEFVDDTTLRIESEVSNRGRTGVEMEALMAISIAALTLYDMCKAIDRSIEIGPIRLLEKEGGQSGHWQREA
ncbi:MAG: cyclic pyranopterin monophosphate synthase MoaC [Planctomycetaceae bacterium]